MLIKSQKKTLLINMDNVSIIWANNGNIVVDYVNGEHDSIANYSTEEKAIKALDMIQNSYQYCEECKYTGVGASQPEFAFQMPQDSEV